MKHAFRKYQEFNAGIDEFTREFIDFVLFVVIVAAVLAVPILLHVSAS